MKAVVLEKNALLATRDLEIPPTRDDECLVRINAAGICSSDIYRGFENGAYFYPLVMGHEMAGEIAAKGKTVADNLKIGDRVAVFPLIPCGECPSCAAEAYAQCARYDYYGSRRHGGFAEYLNVKAWNLLKLPDEVNDANAAALEPASVVYHAVAGLNLSGDAPLCILGAGFLGLIAVKLVRLLHPETEVTILDRNAFKLEIAAKLGAKTRLLRESADWDDYVKQNAGKFPRVLESCGAPGTFRFATVLAAPFATVVWMGNISGDLAIPQKEVSSILRKEIVIKGTWNSTYRGAKDSDWTRVLELMKKGLAVDELISHRVNLDTLPETLRKLHAHKARTETFDCIKAAVTRG